MTIAAIRGPVTQSHPQMQSQSQWKEVWSSQHELKPVLLSRRPRRLVTPSSSRRQSWIIIYSLLIIMTTSICVYLMHQCWQFHRTIGMMVSVKVKTRTSMKTTTITTTTITSTHTTHNNVLKKMVLVHLGKTAGSSVTCMLHCTHHSTNPEKGNSQCDPSNYQPSAIANIVNKQIHLEPAPVDEYDDEYKYEYDDFLITVRNPLR